MNCVSSAVVELSLSVPEVVSSSLLGVFTFFDLFSAQKSLISSKSPPLSPNFVRFRLLPATFTYLDRIGKLVRS